MTKHERKLFQNIYKLASFLSKRNRLRANDVGATDLARSKADGLASAYECITTMMQNVDLLANTDYDKANKCHTDLPAWMEGETD